MGRRLGNGTTEKLAAVRGWNVIGMSSGPRASSKIYHMDCTYAAQPTNWELPTSRSDSPNFKLAREAYRYVVKKESPIGG